MGFSCRTWKQHRDGMGWNGMDTQYDVFIFSIFHHLPIRHPPWFTLGPCHFSDLMSVHRRPVWWLTARQTSKRPFSTFAAFSNVSARSSETGLQQAATPSEGNPTYKQVHQIPSSLVLNVKLLNSIKQLLETLKSKHQPW